MDNPVATVISVSEGSARVEVAGQSACPRCAAGKGCGAGIFSAGGRPVTLTAGIGEGMEIALEPGDRVVLSLAPADLVRAALIVYGAPLAGLLLASGLALLIVDPLTDLAALSFAVPGLVLGGIAGRRLAARDACVQDLAPTITGLAARDLA